MLQFWKKQSRNKNNNVIPKNESQLHDLKRTTINNNESRVIVLDEDLTTATKQQSKLSKTLDDIFSDKNALNYFIQFMESRNSLPFIYCWLDIDTFKNDLLLQPQKDLISQSSKAEDHDSLSVSTDCDSYTNDSLCFDEKTLNCDGSDSVFSVKSNNDDAVEHALAIFKKYVALEACLSVNCDEMLRKEVMENICDRDNVLTGHCFDRLQQHVYVTMKSDYFDVFVNSDYFCKHQIDVLTSGNVVLDDILCNETALFYFMEYLEQENHRHLLEFWIAATNFQKQLIQNDGELYYDPFEAQNDAVVLYDKYFSLQAHCPLGFSDKIRFTVEQSICSSDSGGLLDINCFDLPLKIIEQVLDRNYLKPFLGSQLFYKYLSELINAVQSSGYNTNYYASKSCSSKIASDCCSERSFSTSTFLAFELPHKSCNVNAKSDNKSMTIDMREVYDPDSLWQRRKVSKSRLCLGRVNELGQYIRETEPEPSGRTSKLRQMVRKFVSLDEDEKRREDMAWQVAEMIVKDITSVTLMPKDS